MPADHVVTGQSLGVEAVEHLDAASTAALAAFAGQSPQLTERYRPW